MKEILDDGSTSYLVVFVTFCDLVEESQVKAQLHQLNINF